MSDSDSTGDVKRTEETWTYMGVREGSKGAAHQWMYPDGTTALYTSKSRTAYVVGWQYTMNVSTDPSGGRTYWGTPAFTGTKHESEEDIKRWRSMEIAAQAAMQLVKDEAKAKRDDPFAKTIAPLIAHAKTLKTNAQRDAFAARVIRELQRSAWS